MLGAISKRDVLIHPATTISCFGWRVFLRTLVAGRNQTFLSVLMREGAFDLSKDKALEVVERCARLEQSAKRIYQSLAERFAAEASVQEFFVALARQEEEHEELLETCRMAAMRGRWDGCAFDSLRESVPLMERRMREADAKLRAVKTVGDALWLTIEIESSELNRLFQAVVAATDSEFVRKCESFRIATKRHLDYVHETITAFEPGLKSACERMRETIGVDSVSGDAPSRRP
jgi:hypothetical protein